MSSLEGCDSLASHVLLRPCSVQYYIIHALVTFCRKLAHTCDMLWLVRVMENRKSLNMEQRKETDRSRSADLSEAFQDHFRRAENTYLALPWSCTEELVILWVMNSLWRPRVQKSIGPSRQYKQNEMSGWQETPVCP
jgi:hypothetical protein